MERIGHVLDQQWAWRRHLGLDMPPIWRYRGWSYYAGVEHDDGATRKLSHIGRDPSGELYYLRGISSYRTMTFEQFRREIDNER